MSYSASGRAFLDTAKNINSMALVDDSLDLLRDNNVFNIRRALTTFNGKWIIQDNSQRLTYVVGIDLPSLPPVTSMSWYVTLMVRLHPFTLKTDPQATVTYRRGLADRTDEVTFVDKDDENSIGVRVYGTWMVIQQLPNPTFNVTFNLDVLGGSSWQKDQYQTFALTYDARIIDHEMDAKIAPELDIYDDSLECIRFLFSGIIDEIRSFNDDG